MLQRSTGGSQIPGSCRRLRSRRNGWLQTRAGRPNSDRACSGRGAQAWPALRTAVRIVDLRARTPCGAEAQSGWGDPRSGQGGRSDPPGEPYSGRDFDRRDWASRLADRPVRESRRGAAENGGSHRNGASHFALDLGLSTGQYRGARSRAVAVVARPCRPAAATRSESRHGPGPYPDRNDHRRDGRLPHALPGFGTTTSHAGPDAQSRPARQRLPPHRLCPGPNLGTEYCPDSASISPSSCRCSARPCRSRKP